MQRSLISRKRALGGFRWGLIGPMPSLYPQACQRGHSQHLEHLLFYGAEPGAQNASGNTALHICALYNKVSPSNIHLPLQRHMLHISSSPLHSGLLSPQLLSVHSPFSPTHPSSQPSIHASSIHPFTYRSTHLSIHQFTYLLIRSAIYPPTHQFSHAPTHSSIQLQICPSIPTHLSTYHLSTYPPTYLQTSLLIHPSTYLLHSIIHLSIYYPIITHLPVYSLINLSSSHLLSIHP